MTTAQKLSKASLGQNIQVEGHYQNVLSVNT